MPRKSHTAEQIICPLRQAEVELAQGRTAQLAASRSRSWDDRCYRFPTAA